MDQIKAMLEAMKNDTTFGNEMMVLIKGGNIAEIIELAEKEGFVFSEADWQAFIDWSKATGKKSESKELSLEELENISRGTSGLPWDPHRSSYCFFHAGSGAEFKDGAMRRKCNQLNCTKLAGYMETIAFYFCRCWGTEKCVDAWHILPEQSGFEHCGGDTTHI